MSQMLLRIQALSLKIKTSMENKTQSSQLFEEVIQLVQAYQTLKSDKNTFNYFTKDFLLHLIDSIAKRQLALVNSLVV